jgi:hypothetical protein
VLLVPNVRGLQEIARELVRALEPEFARDVAQSVRLFQTPRTNCPASTMPCDGASPQNHARKRSASQGSTPSMRRFDGNDCARMVMARRVSMSPPVVNVVAYARRAVERRFVRLRREVVGFGS